MQDTHAVRQYLPRLPVVAFHHTLWGPRGEWDVEVIISYNVCPADPKCGVDRPSPESVRVVYYDNPKRDLEDRFRKMFEDDIRDACLDHMESGDRLDPYDVEVSR